MSPYKFRKLGFKFFIVYSGPEQNVSIKVIAEPGIVLTFSKRWHRNEKIKNYMRLLRYFFNYASHFVKCCIVKSQYFTYSFSTVEIFKGHLFGYYNRMGFF